MLSIRSLKRVSLLLVTLLLVMGLGMYRSLAQSSAPWRIGMDPAFPPFEMRDEATGKLTGFDVELIRAIAQQAGQRIQFVPMPFDGLIPALQSRSVDAVISGMTISAQRAQAVDFSRPYFRAGLAIAVQDSNQTIRSLDDLQNRRIAVQIGTIGAQKAVTIPGAKVSQFDSTPLILQELANGNVDAVLQDLPATLYAINQANLQGIQPVGALLTEDFYGIATPRNSKALPRINRALDRLIADGTYARIYQHWFNQTPPELPTVAPVLQAKTRENGLNWGVLAQNLMRGTGVTLSLTIFSFSFGALGGTLIALLLLTRNRFLVGLCQTYVYFFRGTPMLVQLFMIYFGIPALFQDLGWTLNLDRFLAAVLALSLNVAAYLSETLRAGIESIDRGQWEAGESLAMNPLETLRFVILPQALRRILPPLANEFITLIKDTSLAAVIGFDELFRQGQLAVATTYRAFEIYIAVAIVYLVITSLAALLFRRLEKAMAIAPS